MLLPSQPSPWKSQPLTIIPGAALPSPGVLEMEVEQKFPKQLAWNLGFYSGTSGHAPAGELLTSWNCKVQAA